MPTMNESTRLRQNERVACRVYDGLAEVITLDQPIRQHRLNRTGTRIWQLAERGATVGELAERLCAEFAVDPARAREDARTFCADLVRRGILLADAAEPERG
jgi:hypothetical protein